MKTVEKRALKNNKVSDLLNEFPHGMNAKGKINLKTPKFYSSIQLFLAQNDKREK
jgi:hypothetical protein